MITANKIILTIILCSITGIGIAHADLQISVYQDTTVEEQNFLDIVGELRNAGIYISYTIGQGITYLQFPPIYAEPFEVEVPFDYNKSGCTYTLNVTERYDCQ